MMRKAVPVIPKNTPQPALPSASHSLQSRVVWLAIILATFIIVVISTFSFFLTRTLLDRFVREELLSTVALAEDTIEQRLQEDQKRTSLLASHTDIKAILEHTAAPQTLERLLVVLQRDESTLEGIAVFDTNEQMLASAGSVGTFPSQGLQMPVHQPFIGEQGWMFYDIAMPVWTEGGKMIGAILLRYDTSAIATPILTAASLLHIPAELLLLAKQEGDIAILHPALSKDETYVLYLETDEIAHLAAAQALDGKESIERAEDYRGRDTLVAFRFLPSLGWGLALQMERSAAFGEMRALAFIYNALGLVLIVFAGTFALFIGRETTESLRHLAARVRALRPGHWLIHRSIHTDDEVEALEQVIVDMGKRLGQLYRYQEKEIEKRTKELVKQYALDRAILNHIGYGVLIIDRKGMVTGSNPAARAMLKTETMAPEGKHITEAFPICSHRGNPLKGEHPVLRSIQSRSIVRVPATAHQSIHRVDGTFLPVLYVASPLFEKKELFGAIIVFQDISEERRLDYLKSEFIALASHQLRTPLSSLRWYAELFAENRTSFTAEQRGYLREIQGGIERMIALLNSLLHAAQLENENIKKEERSVDVRSMLRELHNDCRNAPKKMNIRCALDIPGKPLRIKTDPTLLRIVLQNLLSNAMKYSRGSKNTIAFHLKETKNTVEFSVSDEGMGIPKQEQARVFQRFFRAENVRKMDTDGNGLGLSIAKSIIERLGGSITFRSVENEGSVFTVTLPKKSSKTAHGE